MAATLAANTIFVFSLLASLNGEQRAMFVFATVVLAGGLFFSIRQMQRLNKPR
jgi:FtsH-binding integral membrane protein